MQGFCNDKMKQLILLILLALLLASCFIYYLPAKSTAFTSQIKAIDAATWASMQAYTWRVGCPVDNNQLVLLELTYYGFDKRSHRGSLIVNRELAPELAIIFQHLYEQRYPIASMKPIELYQGDDLQSMNANNTSAFNCRKVTGQKNIFSQHSYGRAIDINALLNPYIKGDRILPEKAKLYRDRKSPKPGLITENSAIVAEFSQQGWDWGGHWHDIQDYQHFEKRAHGEKRNPYGY